MSAIYHKESSKFKITQTRSNLKTSRQSVDIKQDCLILCQQYLGGIWHRQTTQSITVVPLTGGTVHPIYYCAIKVTNNDSERSAVPVEVVIKFNQLEDSSRNHNYHDRNIIVSLMVSENGLGPKIYGIFDRGIIYKFYKV